MDQLFTEAKDTATALKYLTEAKALLRQDDYSFKEVEELLLKASKSTRHETYLELARLYERHNIFDEALKWYMCKYNHSMLEGEDVVKVASWYEQGIGTEIDCNMAVKLYTKIAFINDEALKGAIRLYKNKKIDYVRNLAPGLMTLDKWEDEAIKRGVIKEDRVDKQTLQNMSNGFWTTSDNDDEIIKGLGKSGLKPEHIVMFVFLLFTVVMMGSAVSDYLEKVYKVNDGHWFSVISVMLLGGGFCSFIPVLIYSVSEIKTSKVMGMILFGFFGGILATILTGFEHMESGITGVFAISAFMSSFYVLEYNKNMKERIFRYVESTRTD